jgi:hypothetical protein
MSGLFRCYSYSAQTVIFFMYFLCLINHISIAKIDIRNMKCVLCFFCFAFRKLFNNELIFSLSGRNGLPEPGKQEKTFGFKSFRKSNQIFYDINCIPLYFLIFFYIQWKYVNSLNVHSFPVVRPR